VLRRVLPEVPKKYGDRSQWGGASNPAYHRLVTGPMTVLGQNPALMPAVVRYVEAKAVINGTTTSQGIALFSDAGARRLYRGIIRTVEATDDPGLPEAVSRIADVEAADAGKFLARLGQPPIPPVGTSMKFHVCQSNLSNAHAGIHGRDPIPSTSRMTSSTLVRHRTDSRGGSTS
jgi:hypothetical protein